MSADDPQGVQRVDRRGFGQALLQLFLRAGYSKAAANVTVSNLIRAQQAGVWSHGIGLALRYLEDIERGITDASASPTISKRARGIISVDANEGPGHFAMAWSLEQAISSALKDGSCLLWIRNLHHVGALGPFLDLCVAQACSAFLTVTSVADPTLALVAAPGDSKRTLGTNPVSIVICDSDVEVLRYDGALAEASFFGIERAAAARDIFAEAAVCDRNGVPSREPSVFYEDGAILSLGGGRGFGLSLALGLLAQLGQDIRRAGTTSAFAMVIHSSHLGEGMRNTLGELLQEHTRMPGERYREPLSEIVDLDSGLLKRLLDRGLEYGSDPCI